MLMVLFRRRLSSSFFSRRGRECCAGSADTASYPGSFGNSIIPVVTGLTLALLSSASVATSGSETLARLATGIATCGVGFVAAGAAGAGGAAACCGAGFEGLGEE